MFVRVLAIAALAGQLQALPATTLCTLRHRAPVTSCESHSRTTGPALNVASAGLVGACAALPCMTAGSTAALVPIPGAFLRPTYVVASEAPAIMPVSFASAPVPPPPEL
jgi:hypothetical protein